MDLRYPYLDELVDFHGHLCPGLAIGYRATIAGLERLEGGRARDEEMIAIVENDSCSVDAVQFLAGATFGKGNLIFRDWGKQVFTFARRDGRKAVRVALKGAVLEAEPQDSGEDSKRKKTEFILNAPIEELFDIRESSIELPPMAQIHRSVICDNCEEPAMDTRIVEKEGRSYCMDCARNI